VVSAYQIAIWNSNVCVIYIIQFVCNFYILCVISECMRIDKYISLGLYSLSAYLVIFFIGYVFFIQNIVLKIFKNTYYITLETLSLICVLFIYFSILLLLFFCIEKYIRKKFPKILPKVNFINPIKRNVYKIFFYVGFYFTTLNIAAYLIFIFNFS